MGFALAIQALVEKVQRSGGLMWSTWYLDDRNLLGGPEKVAAAFKELSEGFGQLGAAEVNMGKCEVWGLGRRSSRVGSRA